MTFVEVVVNVPLRRREQRLDDEIPFDDPHSAEPPAAETEPTVQAFHYHLPPELEGLVRPGQLVWVPFGPRTIQGIVSRLSDTSPVTTKPLIALARDEVVLDEQQLRLAAWMSHYYVAPIAEAVKLMLPPGLLKKSPESLGVKPKRELLIEVTDSGRDAAANISQVADLGRNSLPARVLEFMLGSPGYAATQAQLRRQFKSSKSYEDLLQRDLVEVFGADGEEVRLAVSKQVAQAAIMDYRGLRPFAEILQILTSAGAPMWRSELSKRVQSDPPRLRQLERSGLIRMTESTFFRDPLAGRLYPRSEAPTLTGEQQEARVAILNRGFRCEEGRRQSRFLLHGVTGSGKTEIYLAAIEETLAQGKQAIVLVPEIALTPQTVARFAGRFPGRVTVVHSAMTPGERFDVWRALRAGEFDIVVGPRSALFAPLPHLGLIVIDEEHEPSYKQDAEEWGPFAVFYDARTVAQHLSEMTGCVVISGSATPSMEIFRETQTGSVVLLELSQRVVGHGPAPLLNSGVASPVDYGGMPPVEVVDMRQELRAGQRSIFSRSLQAELHATLDAGEQAILFLNRRGANTFVMCRDCGDVATCPHCDVPLVYHFGETGLRCHHCNRVQTTPTECPRCASRRIKYFGSGTEQIEQLVREISPRARVIRWDADTTGGRGSHESILQRFAAHEADVLVGTQMIAKGLDLPLVTLVGVIAADVGLHLPDFRASERTFQLLTQVAGRAGRSSRGGRVVVQTYTPQHYAIQAAAQHDYHAFYQREIAFRTEHGYPPAARAVRLVYWHKHPEKAQAVAKALAGRLRQLIRDEGLASAVRLMGPSPAFFSRSRGYYRWQILLAGTDPSDLVRRVQVPIGWRVDVDPMTVL